MNYTRVAFSRLLSRSFVSACFVGLVAPALPGDTTATIHPEALSGGDTTVFDTGRDAFALSARNLSRANRRAFFVGNSFFNENWVSAPSSTEGRDGLGPLFNAISCSACHFKDGRGTPPLKVGDPVVSMIIRLSAPQDDGSLGPEPNYGGQFQNNANPGIPKEGDVKIAYAEKPGKYPDGTTYSLRVPTYQFENLAHGSFTSGTLISPRVSPHLVGLGLLEAIPEKDLLALADPDDKDGDGISGRPNKVTDVRNNWIVTGRFGWKANQPSLEQQNAGAFHGDLGITSSLFPQHEIAAIQKEAAAAPNGGEPELEDDKLARMTQYTQSLAVPARRNMDDPDVAHGQALFEKISCNACHVQSFRTGEFPDMPELANQQIYPYTDLLLHDMGPDLADNRPDGEATGSEWRTPPLWGIGLIETVNGHTNFLHDGRARNFEEAILWHGGEAEDSARKFRELTAQERGQLLKFLESL